MIEGQPYSFYKFQQIRKEQLLIALLSKGAVTVSETDNMPIHDRKLLLNTLRQMEEEKKKKLEEIKQNKKFKKN